MVEFKYTIIEIFPFGLETLILGVSHDSFPGTQFPLYLLVLVAY